MNCACLVQHDPDGGRTLVPCGVHLAFNMEGRLEARHAALEEEAKLVQVRTGHKHVADEVRALLDDAGSKSCYCDAPEIQTVCPVHRCPDCGGRSLVPHVCTGSGSNAP